VIAPFLWRRGIGRIDILILSHPHPDHANGLASLVDSFEVGEIWTNGQETTQPGTLRLMELAARRGIPVRLPDARQLVGVTIETLGPVDPDGRLGVDSAASENDNSVVVRLGYAGRYLLFPGDLEAEGEAALISRDAERLHADVLKVPHHGSRTSSTLAFLEAVRPRLAVFSVGDRNRWGFPHPSVVERYQELGTQQLRTDRDGAITVTIHAGGRIDVVRAR
jgi:competence protein ComEC